MQDRRSDPFTPNRRVKDHKAKIAVQGFWKAKGHFCDPDKPHPPEDPQAVGSGRVADRWTIREESRCLPPVRRAAVSQQPIIRSPFVQGLKVVQVLVWVKRADQ